MPSDEGAILAETIRYQECLEWAAEFCKRHKIFVEKPATANNYRADPTTVETSPTEKMKIINEVARQVWQAGESAKHTLDQFLTSEEPAF